MPGVAFSSALTAFKMARFVLDLLLGLTGNPSPAFRRRQEDLGRMATELMALVQDGKITPTVAEQITLEAIPKALERLAEGHVRGKIVARVQS